MRPLLTQLRDEVIIEKPDGQRSAVIASLFDRTKITILAANHLDVDVEEGDKAIRVLPGGKTESYTILEVQFTSGIATLPNVYQLHVRKDTSLAAVEARGRTTNINIHDSHGIQVGDYNSQHFVTAIHHILTQIEQADAPESVKTEAKSRMQAFLAHPLVSSLIGAAAQAGIGAALQVPK